jgi:chaperonin cofactor prefoldin
MERKLGDLLVKDNIISTDDLEEALEKQKTDIENAIARYFDDHEDSAAKLEQMLTEIGDDADMEVIQTDNEEDDMDLSVQVNDAPVIKLVNATVAGLTR